MRTPDQIRYLLRAAKGKASGGGNPGDDGMSGHFEIGYNQFVFIASWGGHWDHVSIRARAAINCVEAGGASSVSFTERTPTWDEMCVAKDIFFNETECVMQLHPPKKDYVNRHPHVLHLWKPQTKAIPRPPKIFV